jgi:hypothetical protein
LRNVVQADVVEWTVHEVVLPPDAVVSTHE